MTYSYADLRDGAGLDLGASRWIAIDQERINLFADVSEDHQWIHVDLEQAALGACHSTIAHGYLTITVVGTLLGELLHLDDSLLMVNYGLDRLRFTAPVPAGSLLRARAIVRDVVEATTGLRLMLDVTGEVDGSEKAVCSAIAIVLVRQTH